MIQLSREVSVLDCHIHYARTALMPSLMDIMNWNGIEKINIVCTPHTRRLSMVPEALHLKAHHPRRVYVFGGLDISPFFLSPETCGGMFVEYVDILANMGCDGVKMIEGKPDTRKTMPIPDFDSPVYEPYWAKMAESGMPLLFHVNDPEEFWDWDRIPVWAKEQGWFYDHSYVNNEEQYRQVLKVMRRFPRLKVVFAHFFFLSAQLERLGAYLDEFPNMHVDLTPGIEMYFNFARKTAAAREFFLRYQDRILYGTDIGAKALLSDAETSVDAVDAQTRIDLVRSFLEASGPLEVDYEKGFLFGKFDGQLEGIGLPKEALEKIYHGNFERLAGETPRPLNPDAIIRECRRLAGVIPMMGAVKPGESADPSVAEMAADFFEGARDDLTRPGTAPR